jgi:thiol-disulfide isomerase/thioredoxin
VTRTLPPPRHWSLPILLLGALLLPDAPASAEVGVGNAAPPFILPDGADRPIALADFRGRVIVLDFTASWCHVCRTALPALAALAERYTDRGVALVTVVIDARRKDADRFLAEVVPRHRMTVLFDPSARLLARFGADGMPALYVIDAGGTVRFRSSGYVADREAEVIAVLERLLAADEVARTVTSATPATPPGPKAR